MARRKSRFVCQQCGFESGGWLGRCSGCGAWSSFVETLAPASPSPARRLAPSLATGPRPITEVALDGWQRLRVPIGEFDRVLGGGIVPGSVALVGGDPGIGKSTLLLQVSAAIAAGAGRVLYISGEESPPQIRMRAGRLKAELPDLLVLAETSLERALEALGELRPALAVVDSIQTMALDDLESAPGSIGQMRECTLRLVQFAKATHVPVFLVGHVTKEGALAGPRVVEHMVDAVLYLEGERFHSYRLLRGVKNRFGSTNEVGVFEMHDEGLLEVPNPSAAFLADREEGAAGSSVLVTLEGTRPLLVELQALVSPTVFGLPRRSANGVEYNRLVMLLAVLGKRLGLPLASQDVYVNVAGGIKVGEPAADLAVALAVISSLRNSEIPREVICFGEVGLAGELRPVGQVDRRLAEAAKLGFQRCILPRACLKNAGNVGLRLDGAASVAEAQSIVFDTR